MQAAQMTLTVPYNTVENSSSANITADNYYQTVAANDQSGYLAELAGYYANETDINSVIRNRVDGACPIVNPTAAEAAQWAANKWGINPAYLYADACQEGNWDMQALGDPKPTNGYPNGTSFGIWQTASRVVGHGWSGFTSGAGQNVPIESTCFQADFYMMTRWGAYTGNYTGDGSFAGNVAQTVGSWDYGNSATSTGNDSCPCSSGNGTDPGYYADWVINLNGSHWVNSSTGCCSTGNCWSSTIAIHPPAGTSVPND
jgi:hypothetical protein